MTIETTILRADDEIARGRSWRAKEILKSSIPSHGYSTTLFRKLGNVLLAMGDDLEAGRYFLIGIDDPNEAEREAIELFLSRHGNTGYGDLLKHFPSCARLETLEEYPSYLRRQLREMNAPDIIGVRKPKSVVCLPTTSDRFINIGCSVAFLTAIFLMLTGIYTIVCWIWSPNS